MTEPKTDVRAVVMAGGSGTRFWPLSRRLKPKQFLPIAGKGTMIEETVRRIRPLIPYRHIFTVAGRQHTRTIRRLLPGLPAANILVEPRARNTAPSLILATASIHLRNPRAVVVVLASDHLIADPERFRRRLRAAAETAARRECLVTFGIPPTFPSTGYGYVRFRRKGAFRSSGGTFFPVLEFKEKPGLARAKRFLADGRYWWNSGMFVWRADVFARQLERHAPEFYPFWERTREALRSGSAAALKRVFDEIPRLSIDYALMEKADSVVCEGDFGWSDVGAWSSLFDVWKRDGSGNAIRGDGLALETEGTLCYSPDRFTALVGVRDLIVVDTKDALLICPRREDQRVREILDTLARSGRKKLL